MTTIPFDTLQFSTDLIESGVPEKQATAITKAISKAQQEAVTSVIKQVEHDYDLDKIVTNKDLDARIKETELKIELVKAELKRDIAETKTDLIRWIFTVGVGMGLVQIASIVFLVVRLSGTH